MISLNAFKQKSYFTRHFVQSKLSWVSYFRVIRHFGTANWQRYDNSRWGSLVARELKQILHGHYANNYSEFWWILWFLENRNDQRFLVDILLIFNSLWICNACIRQIALQSRFFSSGSRLFKQLHIAVQFTSFALCMFYLHGASLLPKLFLQYKLAKSAFENPERALFALKHIYCYCSA
jgi:hypothetical protein